MVDQRIYGCSVFLQNSYISYESMQKLGISQAVQFLQVLHHVNLASFICSLWNLCYGIIATMCVMLPLSLSSHYKLCFVTCIV